MLKEMRIVTNSKHVAEQIKSDRDKCAVMDDQKIENLESTDGWSKNLGKIGKWENSKIDEETCRRSEEKLCRAIMKGPGKAKLRKTRNAGRHGRDTKDKSKTLCASMMSLAKNCRGVQCAKLENWS